MHRPLCRRTRRAASVTGVPVCAQPLGHPEAAQFDERQCWWEAQRAIAASCSAALQAAARRGDKPDGRSASLCV